MTTETVNDADLDLLLTLLEELTNAGRIEEGRSVARAYTALMTMLYPELTEVPENDPEFIASMEAAERDFAEGRWIPHDEVIKRLQALDNA